VEQRDAVVHGALLVISAQTRSLSLFRAWRPNAIGTRENASVSSLTSACRVIENLRP
jgi:hypothetical protein